jgi:hypothetical protein
MRTGFPFLSKFLSKLLEILGAGLASAAGAFLLGHIATPSAPPAVVQIVPADADTVRLVRGEPKAGAELRRDVTGQSRSVVSAAEKVAKPAVRVLPQKVREPERAARVDGNQASLHEAPLHEVPLHILPTPVGASSGWPTAGQGTDVARPQTAGEQGSQEKHFQLLATLRQIPGWFVPSSVDTLADVPRPPIPVGQFWQSTM